MAIGIEKRVVNGFFLPGAWRLLRSTPAWIDFNPDRTRVHYANRDYRAALAPGELNTGMLARALGVPITRIFSLIAGTMTRETMRGFITRTMTMRGGNVRVFSETCIPHVAELLKLTGRNA